MRVCRNRSRPRSLAGRRDDSYRGGIVLDGLDGLEVRGPPVARPFDEAQDERHLRPGDGFRLGVECAFRRDGIPPWRICDLLSQERRMGMGEEVGVGLRSRDGFPIGVGNEGWRGSDGGRRGFVDWGRGFAYNSEIVQDDSTLSGLGASQGKERS